jgi:hypothetical protein
MLVNLGEVRFLVNLGEKVLKWARDRETEKKGLSEQFLRARVPRFTKKVS